MVLSLGKTRRRTSVNWFWFCSTGWGRCSSGTGRSIGELSGQIDGDATALAYEPEREHMLMFIGRRLLLSSGLLLRMLALALALCFLEPLGDLGQGC